jgi:hypothetical protein
MIHQIVIFFFLLPVSLGRRRTRRNLSSGTISYLLGAAGLISTPMSSTEFRSHGERGAGKWIMIYLRECHTFAVIAGLRLDTTPYDRYTGKWAPRWQTIYRPPRGFDARHSIGL